MSIGNCLEKFESSNLSRDNLSREIGRTRFEAARFSGSDPALHRLLAPRVRASSHPTGTRAHTECGIRQGLTRRVVK